MTIQEAKEQKVFTIEGCGSEKDDLTIKEDTWYDLVQYIIDPTWASRFCKREWCRGFDEVPFHIIAPDIDQGYEVYEYSYHARPKHKTLGIFENEEDADDFIFEIYEKNAENDCNYIYFFDSEEAEESLLETLSDIWNVDIEVAKSIFCKKRKVEELRKERSIKFESERKERVEKLSTIYSKMIDKIEGESYKETAQRLSKAIGERIEGAVFHKAVKIIRS